LADRAALGRLVGLALVLAGKVLGQGALLACGIVVARVAGPTEFALYSTLLMLVLLADACLGSPIDYAVIRFTALHGEDRQRTDRLQSAAFRMKILIGAGLAVGAALFGGPVARTLLHNEAGGGLIWLAVGLTSALLLNRSVAAYFQSRSQFRLYSLFDAAQGVLRATVVAALAFWGAKTAGAYLGGLLAASVVLLLASFWVTSQIYLTAGWPNRRDTLETFHFLGMTTGIIVLGTITGRTDLLFLAHAIPPAEVAHYAGASQLASLATLLAGYASIVAQPILIPAVRRGQAPRLLAESSGLALIGAGGFLLVIWLFAEQIMKGVFGAAFAGSSPLLRILTIGTSIDLFCMPVAMTFLLQFRPRTALVGEFVITAAYLALAWPVADAGPIAMAWLVTGVRAAKGALYVGATLYLINRRSFEPRLGTAADQPNA
jgi:O-antigen/teichoic acid export membrane protein